MNGEQKSLDRTDTNGVRIGIDGRYQGQPLTGVPRYIDELCKQLDVLLPDANFFLYTANAEGIRLPSPRWTLRVEPNTHLAKLRPNVWWKFFAHRLIRQDSLNVLWAAAGLLPRKLPGVPYVLTVYDLTFRLFPETMSRMNLWAHRLFFEGDLKRANNVIAISEGTSEKLKAFYGRGADTIVRPDASERFSRQPPERQAEVRAKYGLNQPFLLAVSTLEPRKNLVSLIEAFLILKRMGDLPQHELILIGKKGWRDGALSSLVETDSGKIIRSIGYVPDADLPALYSACDLFCMPSLYEGFGIPVLEARRCGARVLTTDIVELREAGDSECTFCGETIDAIKSGIQSALSSKSYTHRLGIAATSWNNECKKMLKYLGHKEL